VGFCIWLFATSVIQGHIQLLNESNLTQEEIWTHEGSLQWWRYTQTTSITPLVTIMITIGFISLVGQIVWTKASQRQVLKAFSENLKLASAEKFEIK